MRKKNEILIKSAMSTRNYLVESKLVKNLIIQDVEFPHEFCLYDNKEEGGFYIILGMDFLRFYDAKINVRLKNVLLTNQERVSVMCCNDEIIDEERRLKDNLKV